MTISGVDWSGAIDSHATARKQTCRAQRVNFRRAVLTPMRLLLFIFTIISAKSPTTVVDRFVLYKSRAVLVCVYYLYAAYCRMTSNVATTRIDVRVFHFSPVSCEPKTSTRAQGPSASFTTILTYAIAVSLCNASHSTRKTSNVVKL